MIKIGLNLLWFNPSKTSGAIKFTENLIAGFDSLEEKITLILYCNPIAYNYFLSYDGSKRIELIRLGNDNRFFNICFIWLFLKKRAVKDGIQSLINPVYYIPLTFTTKFKSINVIHDFNSYFFKENFSLIHRLHHLISWNLSCYFSDHVVLISDTMLKQAKLILKNYKHKFTRIYVPVVDKIVKETEVQRVLRKYNLKKDSYVYLITSSPSHKNNNIFITSFINHIKKTNSKTSLVISGRVDFIKQLIKIPSEINNQIIFTGFITDTHKFALLQSCKFLVMPSLYEGFGMPIAEAIFKEKPIVCSEIDIFKEITNSSGIFVSNPNEITSWQNILEKLDINKTIITDYKDLETKYKPNKIALEYYNLITRVQ